MAWRLLTAGDIARLPDPTWLVDYMVPDGGFVVLYGPPGVGKSFVALDLACRVATGTPFLKHTTLAGTVVYVAAEGLYTFKFRERAWRRTFWPVPDHRLLHLGEAVQLQNEAHVRQFIRLVEPVAPRLIVFDTLARCSVGVNENEVKEMGQVISGIDEIRRATGATVLAIHHSRKPSEDNPEIVYRGSTALEGAADTMLRLTGTPTALLLECTKQKDDEAFSPRSMRLWGSYGSAVLRYAGADLTEAVREDTGD